MATFRRDGAEVEVVREGLAVVEYTGFGVARRERYDERATLISYYMRIAELLEDRWQRTSEFIDDLAASAEPALVADIDAGDRDALAVYTDWLLERGDPRGELAVLRATPELDMRRIASLEKTRRVELFGPLGMLDRRWREQFTYLWRDGWIDEVIFHRREDDSWTIPPDKEVMQHALHAPMARFTRWLTVDDWYVMPIWECLGRCTCLANIRGVRHDAVTSCFREMLDALPALEELELRLTSITTGGHPRVRRLRVTVDDDPLDIRGEWPALRQLEIVCKRPVDADQLAGVRARFGADIALIDARGE